jgi:hypothetical protein
MNKYLQRAATLVETDEESFIQCEVCGRCYSLEDWDTAQVMPSEKYGLTCTHQDEEPGEPTTYNGWANYDTWNVMLWLDNDEQLYRESCRYFESVRREQKRPTYKGLHAWLVTRAKVLGVTPDGVSWMSHTLDYAELDRGIRVNFDCWAQYN